MVTVSAVMFYVVFPRILTQIAWITPDPACMFFVEGLKICPGIYVNY